VNLDYQRAAGDEPVKVTIELSGAYDILRFVNNMTGWQVDIASQASDVLYRLRREIGAERFDPWAKEVLGEGRFEQLRKWGAFRRVTS
jgi:hypothetical protein